MKSPHYAAIAPRTLRFRHQFIIYFKLLLFLAFVLTGFWGTMIFIEGVQVTYNHYFFEILFSGVYLLFFTLSYFFWWRLKLEQTIQVTEESISIERRDSKTVIDYQDIASVRIIGWSLFYILMRSGKKYFFNSTLERVDYIWEGIYRARPDLLASDLYESYRVKLVQYDHHQKRKEWFFKHRSLDVLNWCVLPLCFMGMIYFIQSREINIYQPFYYFFRLLMYSLLTLLTTAFFYTLAVKKLVFDKRVEDQLEEVPDNKLRNLEFENIIIQRTKFIQSLSVAFFFALIIKTDFNMFTLTKLRDGFVAFNLPEGKTFVIDNRYNCLDCKYSVKEGDMIVFSKGQIGQVLATAGELIAQVEESKSGRSIASETVMEVPQGHVALQLKNSEEILILKETELVGRLEK